jgi:hypothetical protein
VRSRGGPRSTLAPVDRIERTNARLHVHGPIRDLTPLGGRELGEAGGRWNASTAGSDSEADKAVRGTVPEEEAVPAFRL